MLLVVQIYVFGTNILLVGHGSPKIAIHHAIQINGINSFILVPITIFKSALINNENVTIQNFIFSIAIKRLALLKLSDQIILETNSENLFLL